MAIRIPSIHKLLLAIHGLIAFIFFLHLDHYDEPGFWFLGWDELDHKQIAEDLTRENPIYALFRGELLAGSYATGNGYLIMLSKSLFGSVQAYLLVKFFLLACSFFCLYSLLARFRGETFARNGTLFYLVYAPLHVYEVSILKDDALVSLIIICTYLIAKNRILAALLVTYLIARFRILAFPLPIFFYMYLRGLSGRYTLYVLSLLAVLYVVLTESFNVGLLYGPGNAIELLQQGGGSVFFLTAKYFLGPLPWNLESVDTEFSHFAPWYSFTLILTLVLLIRGRTIGSIRDNFIPLFLIFVCSFGPYYAWSSQLDTVGPRQFAMAGFFYTLMIFEWVFFIRFTIAAGRRVSIKVAT